jgi:integral membrane protein
MCFIFINFADSKIAFILNTAIKNFLNVGKAEGYSYLVLLLIAMPLKYMYNMPEAVRIVGTLHGILFVAFMYTLLRLLLSKQFTFKQCVYAFILSLIPFGTFFLKRILSIDNLRMTKQD